MGASCGGLPPQLAPTLPVPLLGLGEPRLMRPQAYQGPRVPWLIWEMWLPGAPPSPREEGGWGGGQD